MPDNPRIHSPFHQQNRLLLIAIGLWLFTAFSAPIGAAERGTELMNKVKENSRHHEYQQSVAKLTTPDDRGRQSKDWTPGFHWFLPLLYEVFDDYSRSLIKFFESLLPCSTSLLTDEFREGGTQANQRVLQVYFRLTCRLSIGDKNQSFMSSGFTNDGIGGREVARDARPVVSENAKETDVVSIPKDKENTYSKLEVGVKFRFTTVYDF